MNAFPASTMHARSVDLQQCCLIIPAYNPGEGLISLVQDLHAKGFGRIVVVNDGSAPVHAPVFAALAPWVSTVLAHPHNQGKGAALKTAFQAVLHQDFCYVVTLDADGQHLPDDVEKLALLALESADRPVLLGARTFQGDVPTRSRMGNALTRWTFGHLAGGHVSDTQTGLRALPVGVLPALIRLNGERYEYEMNMLAHLVRSKVPLREIPIQTVYLDGNASSHFSPVLDSLRIYWVLCKDLLIAGSSLVLDVALFVAFLHITNEVFLSVVLARVLSAIFNFIGNRFFVFQGPQAHAWMPQLAGYAALVVLFMLTSATLLELVVTAWNAHPVLSKIAIDAVLYLCSFKLRKSWLFRVRNGID